MQKQERLLYEVEEGKMRRKRKKERGKRKLKTMASELLISLQTSRGAVMIFLLLHATAASPKLVGERVGLHHPLNE